MRVFDCFSFFNEFDVLEIRLHELQGVVDRFVLVEADRTHAGQPKPLYFHENRQRFAAFLDRIEHVVVRDMPEGDDPWRRERFQRDCITRGLGGAGPDDLVMVSDVDEIPRAAFVSLMCNLSAPLFALRMPVSYFKINYLNVAGVAMDVGTVAARLRSMPSPDLLRSTWRGETQVDDGTVKV
ncbi:MAG: N-acetylglucosaminyltransferase, partial [Rhodospirillales bacterium]|nr:N-acetylglucosaminyltransferase [Rhodospirillales bacterium]